MVLRILQISALLIMMTAGFVRGDDPEHDEPRTSLMDYTVMSGEIVLGADITNGAPNANGTIAYTGVTPHFNWGGVMDIALPIQAFGNIDWATVDVIAGGHWVFNSKHGHWDDGDEFDKQFGLGLEVFSFEQNTSASDLMAAEIPEGLDASDLVRTSMRGMLVSLGWTLLNQHSEEEGSQSWGISIGAGPSQFGINVPGHGKVTKNGSVFQAKFFIQIFDDKGMIRCVFTNATADHDQKSAQLLVAGTMKVTDHWGVSIGLKHTVTKIKGMDWNFQKSNEMNMEAEQTRFFVGFGYEF